MERTARGIFRLTTLTALAAFLADWSSKQWALQALHSDMSLGSLLLAIERNDAFAFSTASGIVSTELVIAIRLAALVALVWVSRSVAVLGPRYAAGLGLILGGGFGNAADVVFRDGSVVDFIGAGPFALSGLGELHLVFNIADVAVILGIGLLAPLIRDWSLDVQQRVARWEARWLEENA